LLKEGSNGGRAFCAGNSPIGFRKRVSVLAKRSVEGDAPVGKRRGVADFLKRVSAAARLLMYAVRLYKFYDDASPLSS